MSLQIPHSAIALTNSEYICDKIIKIKIILSDNNIIKHKVIV